jgi:subtilisin-like proprotein convertase family protein
MGTSARTRTWFVAALAALLVSAGLIGAGPAQAVTQTYDGGPITIPDAGDAAVSTIEVPETAGILTALTVTLADVEHPYADDLDIVLRGPDGRAVVLASDAGMSGALTGVDVTFDDDAGVDLPVLGPWMPGSVRPTDRSDGLTDHLALDLDATTETLLDAYGGTHPTGTWSLHVLDDTLGGDGAIGGWSLSFTTELPATPPVVTHEPVDVTVLPGVDATFTVDATGRPAPQVQWETTYDGVTWETLPDETGRTLTLPEVVREHDQLLVRARFTNSAGSAVTTAARLTVLAVRPQMTQQPADVAVVPGADAVFSAAAYGDPAPSVQWYTSAGPGLWREIRGATSGQLVLEGVGRADDAMVVRATFTNAAGRTDSQPAQLTVTPVAPMVTVQPQPQAVSSGEDAVFTADATGDPAPSVQWRMSSDGGANFVDVDGATSTTFTLPSVTTELDGAWVLAEFRNAGGLVLSQPVALDVAPAAPAVTVQPTDKVVREGESVTFEVGVAGDPEPTVQWQRSRDGGKTWSDLGGDSTVLTFEHPRVGASGLMLRVVLTNEAGSVESLTATLIVQPRPHRRGAPGGLDLDAPWTTPVL